MFTSKPPFQSSTTDEIYRRARERDYEWPDPETSQRYISHEAKDLVALMLTDADQRPEADEIVQHPFFTTGFMPTEADMSPRIRELAPEQQEFYATRMSSSLQARSFRNLKELCRECSVGPWSKVHLIHTQIWKEMAAEEKAGLTPVIPLAENTVYRSYEQVIKEQQQAREKYAASVSVHAVPSTEDQLLAAQKAPTALLRQPPQSFAAQQRAQNRPPGGSMRLKPTPEIVPVATTTQSLRVRTRRDAVQDTARVDAAENIFSAMRASTRTELPSSRPTVKTNVAERAATISSTGQMSPQRQNSGSVKPATLFSPTERQEVISETKPDVILDRLRRLQGELERALNSRTMAIISSKTASPPHPHVVVKWVDYTNKFGLGYILNDGSVGCILRDIPTTEGSKTAMLPPAGVFIRGAERHILRRQDETYDDRNQPIPMTEPIRFFENNCENGLSESMVSPEQFRVSVNDDGTAGKMNPGKDIYQHRKRERIILWKKFANYMIAYGRDEALPVEETDVAGAMSPGQKGTVAELVTFYQRFGDVGCWMFCDGHLQVGQTSCESLYLDMLTMEQFNFPDHTKIVLDPTGTWCHFWHLPQDAAERLANEGTLGAAALDDRAMLSYPLQTLLNFQSKASGTRSGRTTTSRRRPEIDAELQGIPVSNDFRRKIEFIKNVVKEWVFNGGMGNSSMSRESRLRWTGYREAVQSTEPQKHVWVTIGARWGDQRLSTYVDPRKPWELGEEAESSKK